MALHPEGDTDVLDGMPWEHGGWEQGLSQGVQLGNIQVHRRAKEGTPCEHRRGPRAGEHIGVGKLRRSQIHWHVLEGTHRGHGWLIK